MRSRFLKAFNDILPEWKERRQRIRMVAMKLDSACSRFLSLSLSLFHSPPLPRYLARVDRTRARLFDPLFHPRRGVRRTRCTAGESESSCIFAGEKTGWRSRFVRRSFHSRANRTDAMERLPMLSSPSPPLPLNERTDEPTSRFMPVHSPNEPFAPSNPPGTIILPESRKLPVKTIHLSPIPVKLYPCSQRRRIE